MGRDEGDLVGASLLANGRIGGGTAFREQARSYGSVFLKS